MAFVMTGPLRSTTTYSSTVTTATAIPTKTKAATDPGKVLEEWSSLIGIVTAIVGNALIALALNVQRYAHSRLHKERVRVNQRIRALSKRAQNSSNDASYGTISTNTNLHNCSTRNEAGSACRHEASTNSVQDEPYGHTDSLVPTPKTVDDDFNDNTDRAASNYLRSPYWWLGQVLITLGEMGNFLAYGFAPASIVSPLGVVALISNCIIAPVMFHELFRVRDLWGVVIAVAGVVTVVLSANQEEIKLEPHDVWDAITTMEFEIYLSVTIFLIMILMWASSRYGQRTILIDLGLVGLFGGYTALATKGVSSMLSSTLWRAFTTPVSYALIFILLGTAIMQIRYVNRALQRFDSTQVIPIQFVLFTLCVILGSAILYRDFEKTTSKQAACFVGGCLLTFFGVFLITSDRQQKDNDEEDLLSDVEGVDENISLSRHDEATVLREQEPTTPKSRSRRPSRISRVSFADTIKSETPIHKTDDSALAQKASGNSQHLIGFETAITMAQNPWRESWSSSSSPPSGIRTVITDSTAESTVTSPRENLNATTPLHDLGVDLIYPSNLAVTPRPNTGVSRSNSHHSKAFISPSPLSSTVTTVVKDAFLRDNDTSSSHRSSLRRIRSSIRASLFFSDEDEGNSAYLVYTPLPTSDTRLSQRRGSLVANGLREDDDAHKRSWSVSNALGDFFKSKSKNKTVRSGKDIDENLCPGRRTPGSQSQSRTT